MIVFAIAPLDLFIGILEYGGAVAGALVILYLVFRFLIEFVL